MGLPPMTRGAGEDGDGPVDERGEEGAMGLARTDSLWELCIDLKVPLVPSLMDMEDAWEVGP
jgi:hypothetical protein